MDLFEKVVDERVDAAVRAYCFRKILADSPQVALENAESFTKAFLSFDPETAEGVLDATADKLGSRYSPFFYQVLARDDRPVLQARALFHLSRLDPGEKTQKVLLKLLESSPHAHVRASCLSGLARQKAPVPFKALKSHLMDPDARVRASAMELLLSHDVRGLTDVFRVLLNDESSRVKAQAAVGLWRLGIPVLLELVQDAELVEHRVSLLFALAQTGRDNQARRILVESLGATTESERMMAARSLGKVAESQDIPELLGRTVSVAGRKVRGEMVKLLEQIDPSYTSRVLHAMIMRADESRAPRDLATLITMTGQIRIEIDLDQLLPFLDASDGRVRANAIEAVGPRLRGGDLETVERAFASDIPRVRANAAGVLWKRGSHAAMGELKRMLRHSSSRFRASAVYALGKLGGLIAEGMLQEALNDPDERTRRMAFEALTPEAVPAAA